MADYQFRMIDRTRTDRLPGDQRQRLLDRPWVKIDTSLAGTAANYRPDEALENAINTAITVGEPLLLTGEPGTGKTQAAYFVAYQLNAEPVFHFQAKSTSTANDLLYEFDAVQYFHEAHLAKEKGPHELEKLDKRKHVHPRELWRAFDFAKEHQFPAVLLIDEIDKAPRDFPNDLLHEIEHMQFTIRETGDQESCPREFRPLVFITSNDERRLPAAFLRRCVTHHIDMTEQLLREAVISHKARYPKLSTGFLDTAIRCVMQIRNKAKTKPPVTGELIAWLQVLDVAIGDDDSYLQGKIETWPHLGMLLKHPEDEEAVRR